MLTKSLDNDTTTTTDKNEKFKLNLDENTQKLQQLTKTIKSQAKNEKKYKQINSTDLHKLYKYRRHSNITSRDYLKSISKNIDINKVEGDDLHQDFYIDEIKKNENTLSSTSKTKYDINYIKLNKNISDEENVENITVSTPSIFDLHEDFETFERFDGEFDWEKFITSEMYVQIIKNTTAEPDFRRMLSDEKKATVPDLSKAVTSFEEKFWDDYYLERTIPVHPQVVTGNSNSSKTRLVPRPSLQKTYLETITLPEIKKSLNSDNNIRNLGMRYLNNPRRIPGGQYPVIDGRRNMPTLPTIQTTADQILYDSIIKDIDKDIDI
ncbi:unnamed protein product [Arctia plantaginis]|uniref:Uncharacterized protein n=1 Tax=Arctia plantaginis TaxID=874455 RepID=A0A8S0Z4X2_ARCPL|nr:unnamed protein product [Arctia plantaginis]